MLKNTKTRIFFKMNDGNGDIAPDPSYDNTKEF